MNGLLKYVVTVTEDLLMAAVLVCLFWSLCKLAFGHKGTRFIGAGLIVAVVISGLMAWAKNTTSKIATNQWNFYIFVVTIALTAVFTVFAILFGRKHRKLTYYGSDTDAAIGFGGWAVGISAAALTVALLFYELPDALAYPFNFETAGKGILSAEYFTRLAGFLLALVLIWLYVRFLYLCCMSLNSTVAVLSVTTLALLINAVRCFGLAVSKWTARARWIKLLPPYSKFKYPWAFPLAKFATNETLLFMLLILGLSLVIPAILFFRNLRVNQPYENPAQLRKLKSVSRHNRRIVLAVLCCFALAVVNMTVIDSYNNREVVLSTPESYEVRGDMIYVPLEQVADGALHRFEYTTEKNIGVRWIVIRKPGAGAYGVGLDACDVCGNAGYYQRGEQVVCKRCDVVMNINTIGFKGGCNPIPLEFRIENGFMLFRLSDILAAEKEFK